MSLTTLVKEKDFWYGFIFGLNFVVIIFVLNDLIISKRNLRKLNKQRQQENFLLLKPWLDKLCLFWQNEKAFSQAEAKRLVRDISPKITLYGSTELFSLWCKIDSNIEQIINEPSSINQNDKQNWEKFISLVKKEEKKLFPLLNSSSTQTKKSSFF